MAGLTDHNPTTGTHANHAVLLGYEYARFAWSQIVIALIALELAHPATGTGWIDPQSAASRTLEPDYPLASVCN